MPRPLRPAVTCVLCKAWLTAGGLRASRWIPIRQYLTRGNGPISRENARGARLPLFPRRRRGAGRPGRVRDRGWMPCAVRRTTFFAEGRGSPATIPNCSTPARRRSSCAMITFTWQCTTAWRSTVPWAAWGSKPATVFRPRSSRGGSPPRWGHALLREYLAAYFDDFVRDDGRIKYYIDPQVSSVAPMATKGFLQCRSVSR